MSNSQHSELTLSYPQDVPDRSNRSRLIAVLASSGFIALGAVGMWFFLQQTKKDVKNQVSHPSASTAVHAPDVQESERLVQLSREEVARLNLQTAEVGMRPLQRTVRAPGVVQSNGYQEVRVTPLVGGLVSRTYVQLGDSVKRGQPLASIFSAELSEAQTEYLIQKAELDAEHKKLQRTEELMSIGAASRQELESIQASHSVHQSHTQAAFQRLLLLGLNRQQIISLSGSNKITSEISIVAPNDGNVISRTINTGQVVALGQELFVITDLSTVWIIADFFEKDFAAATIGSRADIITAAYPGRLYKGRVAYIDPRVDPQTRTAKIRIEVLNEDHSLKIGMYVDVSVSTTGDQNVPVVPKSSLQSISSDQVVYVLHDSMEGHFAQRKVELGEEMNGYYRVLKGLDGGERIVTQGSSLLRAESIRNQGSSSGHHH